MLAECMEALKLRPDGIYVDGTLGMGGHSAEIARRLDTGRLIAIDRDAEAIRRAKLRLEPFADRITFVHGNFRDLPALLDGAGLLLHGRRPAGHAHGQRPEPDGL